MNNTLVIIALIASALAMILGGVSILLHLIGPHTKTKWDDNAAIFVDKIVDALKKASGTGLVLILSIHLLGCGASARQTAIHDSFVAVDVAAQAFTTYDALHQQEILNHSSTDEEYQKAVAAWRGGQVRTVAIATITAGYKTVALVASDDKQPLSILGNAVKLVTDTLTQLGVKL